MDNAEKKSSPEFYIYKHDSIARLGGLKNSRVQKDSSLKSFEPNSISKTGLEATAPQESLEYDKQGYILLNNQYCLRARLRKIQIGWIFLNKLERELNQTLKKNRLEH